MKRFYAPQTKLMRLTRIKVIGYNHTIRTHNVLDTKATHNTNKANIYTINSRSMVTHVSRLHASYGDNI